MGFFDSLFKTPHGVTAAEAQTWLLNNEAILLDVREAYETTRGMPKPAKNIPLSKIQENTIDWQKFLNGTPKDKKIVVYCLSGARSGAVVSHLHSLGYQAYNMGSVSSWMMAGLPMR